MALKYTGRANELTVDGRTYRRGGGEAPDENGVMVKYGDLDRVNISKARAAHMAANSRLHSFEDADGADVLEAETAPSTAAAAPTAAAKS